MTIDTMTGLTKEEVVRYSRQLILPEFEVEGQVALKNASVVIVGAGGLGCPVGIYLAAAGIGRIGVIDYDAVERSNLHRQVQHPMRNIGKQKAISLCEQLTQLNDCIQVEPIEALLTSSNALALLSNYDIIVDASDNMATRYLLNDAAVLLDKPLISGSALRWEGHLTVYNYKSSLLEGPCYRCLFPTPPHPSAVTNCNDGGILGAITGLIGSLQALETIMVILKKPNYAQKMFIFDNGQTRTVTLRNKQVDCEACGVSSELRGNGLKNDYALFCGSGPNDAPKVIRLLQPEDRISPEKYYEKFTNVPHILVDVRPPMQYKITHLPNSINLPVSMMNAESVKILLDTSSPVICMCRRGNESQRAVVRLKELGCKNVLDIMGGITEMSRIDPTLASY